MSKLDDALNYMKENNAKGWMRIYWELTLLGSFLMYIWK